MCVCVCVCVLASPHTGQPCAHGALLQSISELPQAQSVPGPALASESVVTGTMLPEWMKTLSSLFHLSVFHTLFSISFISLSFSLSSFLHSSAGPHVNCGFFKHTEQSCHRCIGVVACLFISVCSPENDSSLKSWLMCVFLKSELKLSPCLMPRQGYTTHIRKRTP